MAGVLTYGVDEKEPLNSRRRRRRRSTGLSGFPLFPRRRQGCLMAANATSRRRRTKPKLGSSAVHIHKSQMNGLQATDNTLFRPFDLRLESCWLGQKRESQKIYVCALGQVLRKFGGLLSISAFFLTEKRPPGGGKGHDGIWIYLCCLIPRDLSTVNCLRLKRMGFLALNLFFPFDVSL